MTKNLKRRRGLSGAVAGLDLFVEFFPIGSASEECNVGHGFQVHVHALLNTPGPLSWQEAQRLYRVFCKPRDQAGITLYPDLDIRPILTPARYRGWLRYTLKPMKFEEFYARGAVACADRPVAFNDEFDQTVLEGAHTVYGNVKSPRYYGNVQQRRNAIHEFIGVWQYSARLNKSDFKRIKESVEQNLPLTGEEQQKFDEHCLYLQQQDLQQQDQQRRARKARKECRRKRRGGRRMSAGGPATMETELASRMLPPTSGKERANAFFNTTFRLAQYDPFSIISANLILLGTLWHKLCCIKHDMRASTLLFIVALLTAAISGCTPSKAMQSFVGQRSTELIARWGPPQQRTPDGQGGEIWSYTEQRQWTTPGQVNTTAYGTGTSYGNLYGNHYGAAYYGSANVQATATTTYTPPQTHGYTAYRSFFIDPNGIVYRWAWKGL